MTQIVSAPRNTRQTLLGFALYDAAQGLPSLLNRLDLTGMSRRQICFGVLGRAPESAALAVDGPDYKPRQALAAALNGEEFQGRIRELVLAAFPERRRLVFVHIPKCAGSDLLVTLRRSYPYLHHHLALPAVTGKPALFAALHGLVTALPLTDGIAVSGHVPLRWYTERGLVRFEDELFTTVRNPRDMVYSFVSFLLTRITSDPEAKRHDVRTWLSRVGLTGIAADAPPGFLAELGGQLLRAPAVTSRNMICTNLGTGTEASSIEAMVQTDIELTDTERYTAWRTARFGFTPKDRVNVSRPLFTPELASRADRAFIDGMVGEDMPLYEKIRSRLNEAGTLSIRGRVFG